MTTPEGADVTTMMAGWSNDAENDERVAGGLVETSLDQAPCRRNHAYLRLIVMTTAKLAIRYGPGNLSARSAGTVGAAA